MQIKTAISAIIIITALLMLLNSIDQQPNSTEDKVNTVETTIKLSKIELTKQTANTEDSHQKSTKPEELSKSEITALLTKCDINIEALDSDQHEPPKAILDRLVKSSLVEERLAYSLFSSPAGKPRLDKLHRFTLETPNEPLSLISLITECTSDIENPICDSKLIDSADPSIKSDGSFWLAAAGYFAAKKNGERIHDAITKLDESAYFSNNYIRRIKLLMQVMDSYQSSHFGSNLITAIGIESATLLPSASFLTRWCKNEMNDIKKSNSCLTLGRNLISRPSTYLNQMIGFGLLKRIYEDENNAKAIAALEQQQTDKMGQNTALNKARYIDLLLLTNEKLARDWLDNFETLGEIEAKARLEEDVEQQIQNDKFKPCRLLFESPTTILATDRKKGETPKE